MSSKRIFFTQLVIMFLIAEISAMCQLQCKNDGTCNMGYNDCTCPPGFTGTLCQIESLGLCSDNDNTSDKSLFLITFGFGPDQYSKKNPSSFNFSTNYRQKFASPIDDGMFGFVNAVPDRYSMWHTGAPDHTENDEDGYMYLVNVGAHGGHLFSLTINELCVGLRYQFSAYFSNVISKNVISGFTNEPNIRFEVRTATVENQLLAQLSTGNILAHGKINWSKDGLSFVASTNSVVLLMISNVEGSNGNNVAIDDIELRVCSVETTASQQTPITTLITTPIATSMTTTPITTTTNLNMTITAMKTTVETSPTVEVTGSTSVTKSIMSTIQTTTRTQTSNEQPTPSFTPQQCNRSTNIGTNCDISGKPCDMSNPCKNDGTCNNTNSTDHDYICICLSGFNGKHCESDDRPCKPHTCLNHGTCNETSATTFNCTCDDGWQGVHCESMTNFCENIKCLNNGVCRPLLLNYTCECLSNSYFGRHCEITATKLIVYKTVSKSFAYIVIIAMISVAMFVVIMDILKYCFGIDPVDDERERIRRKKQAKRRKPPVIH